MDGRRRWGRGGRGRSRGVTLVELLVTAAILGIVAPAILVAAGNSARIARGAQKRAAARVIAERHLETFRAGYRGAGIASGTVYAPESVAKVGSFEVRRVISKDGTLGTCEVTVTWSDTNGDGASTESLAFGTMMREGS